MEQAQIERPFPRFLSKSDARHYRIQADRVVWVHRNPFYGFVQKVRQEHYVSIDSQYLVFDAEPLEYCCESMEKQLSILGIKFARVTIHNRTKVESDWILVSIPPDHDGLKYWQWLFQTSQLTISIC